MKRGALPNFMLIGSRAALLLALVALVFAPFLFEPPQIKLLTEFLTVLVLAVMWNLLAGYADILSVGQQAFVGIGAYAFYGCAVLAGINPFEAVILAGFVALLAAVPTMLVIFRLRTAYLAVGTWVMAEVFLLAAGKLKAFGAGPGVSLPVSVVREFGARPDTRYATIYWLALALTLAAYLSTWFLLRSRIGVGLTAMRDDEEGAGAVGVNTARARILCFLWTAPFLGMDGALITLQKLRIAPRASFSITDWTVLIIFIVVIGGIGSLEGPILGAILYFILREYLANLGTWHMIILGVLSIAVIIVEPGGIWGALRRVLGGNLIPVSHRASAAFRSQREK